MCGIVGYAGERPCQELLLDALERLEYRGYDSAGLSLQTDTGLDRVRTVGNLERLRAAVDARDHELSAVAGSGTVLEVADVADAPTVATIGIGHTRWATHGGVTEENAHPHSDMGGNVHVVLNGIIENHLALRRELEERDVVFSSETDAEVVAHLLGEHCSEGRSLTEAVTLVRFQLEGHFAFVALSADEDGLLVATRRECPLVVGVGEGEHVLASANAAFDQGVRRMQIVEEGEVVAVTASAARFFDQRGRERTRAVSRVDAESGLSGMRGYETFMLKEIHEQPSAVAATLEGALRADGIELPDLGLDDLALRRLDRITIVGCGTSYHAGLLGRCAIRQWAGVPVDFDIASEYRYAEPRIGAGDLLIGITQSGETADTLAALRMARSRGARTVALTNVQGSLAARESDGTLLTRAGNEVGVAATKTFVCQVAALYLLALRLAEVRQALSRAELERLRRELAELPRRLREVLAATGDQIQATAERFAQAGFFLYMGRQAGLPVALEGALKLKEISYIPCDAYAAGEMKHGPIAMLSERTPVICIATESPVLGKLLSNIAEVRARGAHVIAIASAGAVEVAEHCEEIVYVPECDRLIAPVLAAVPLQLLAYHVARARGLNVDRPRNLAKTVTVE
jgi:glucosamine--fructose-6-phosphate aminotransferase (isomerizing)